MAENSEARLQDRTVNIMMIAKRFPADRWKSEIAKYMSEECGCPIETYTNHVIFRIVNEAFFDYVYCCDKQRTMAVLRNYFGCENGNQFTERMLIALGLAQVAEIYPDGSHHYICGYHETEFGRKLDRRIFTEARDTLLSQKE